MGNRANPLIGCLAVTGFAACQPMYGSPPARLRAPAPIPHAVHEDPIAPPAFVEACHVDFRAHPKSVHRDPAGAARLVVSGDTRAHTAEHAPAPAAKVELVQQSIADYREALIKDPYDATATLKLALAYDAVLRKGCALAMLQRLAQLSTNPKFADAADRIEDVVQNPSWFPWYRNAALAAIGH
jgi:hypothetical protein